MISGKARRFIVYLETGLAISVALWLCCWSMLIYIPQHRSHELHASTAYTVLYHDPKFGFFYVTPFEHLIAHYFWVPLVCAALTIFLAHTLLTEEERDNKNAHSWLQLVAATITFLLFSAAWHYF